MEVTASPIYAPHFTTSGVDLRKFIQGVPTGPGALVNEFNARRDEQDHGVYITRKEIYEFPWGFLTEFHGIWDFYVADVWRSGTVAYFDRFLSGWKSDCEKQVREFTKQHTERFYISFDDGVSSFSCMSIGCLSGPFEQTLTRHWIGTQFIRDIFPVMVAQALDPNFVYSEDWYLSDARLARL